MRIRDLADAMEQIAPTRLAEDWDNVGLLIGDPAAEAGRVMLCIDLTDAVLDEAVAHSCQAVVAYHPPIFRPIKQITPAACPVAWRAIEAGIAVYSPHTALDIAAGGTNDVLAEALELINVRPLQPAGPQQQAKVVIFLPETDLDAVSGAAFEAGAGRIGLYDHCSFYGSGTGTFRGGPGSDPTVGRPGRKESASEVRLETICPQGRVAEVVHAVREAHSYQTPAIDIYPVGSPEEDRIGMGRVGELAVPAELDVLVETVKTAFSLPGVLLVRGRGPTASTRISRVAVAAGSCGSIFRSAVEAGAELYLTGEMRHHDALAAAAAGLHVVALCHSNSERIALANLAETLTERIEDDVELFISERDADPFTIA